MSKLSSSSISSSSTANVVCQCGVVVEMKTSWTQSNPGRRDEVDVDVFDGMLMKCRLKLVR
ncbi:hypothetical protein H5410_060348 [Solanum commersonii]|uniref:Uncharacterized protein n=1 Tax=Solanum commersonii TaxID=4109 RepID=A0A9J5W6A3_SOLCO|nr:hypothetical protein H5410_060348 [Solanum commersonii]